MQSLVGGLWAFHTAAKDTNVFCFFGCFSLRVLKKSEHVVFETYRCLEMRLWSSNIEG